MLLSDSKVGMKCFVGVDIYWRQWTKIVFGCRLVFVSCWFGFYELCYSLLCYCGKLAAKSRGYERKAYDKFMAKNLPFVKQGVACNPRERNDQFAVRVDPIQKAETQRTEIIQFSK